MSTEFFNDQWRIPSNENQNKISNYSMDFDGTNTKIDFGNVNNFERTDSFSFSLWVNIPSYGTNYYISKQLSSGTFRGYNLFSSSNGKLQFLLNNTFSSNTLYVTSTSQIPFNQWVHLTLTYDGSSSASGVNMYLNGVSETIIIVNDTLSASTLNTTDFQISGRGGGNGNIVGKIDQTTIFDYALSQDQVTQLGADGYAFNFDGSSNYITISNPISIPNDFTWSAWIYPKRVNNSYEMIYTQGTATTGGACLAPYLAVRDTRLHLCITGVYETGLNFITADEWQHVAVTRTSGVLNLYRNGVEYNGARPTQSGTINTNNPGVIGKWYNSSHYFKGEMSNVQIFNTALPATGSDSISTLYNNGKPLPDMSSFTSLQGWWKLDDTATFNSGTSVWSIPDDSSNSNTGASAGMNASSLVASNIDGELISNPMALSPKPIAYYQLGDQSVSTGPSSNYLVPNNSLQDYVFAFAQPVKYSNPGTPNTPIIAQNQGSIFSNINNFSFSGWFNIPLYTYFMAFDIRDDDDNLYFNINMFGNQLRFNVGAGGGYIANFQNIVPVNTWFHYAGVFDGSGTSNTDRLKLYIDGQPQTVVYGTTVPTSFPTIPSDADINLGKIYTVLTQTTMLSSNIQLWNSSLIPSEVETVYNNGSPLQTLSNVPQNSNLELWWKLNASEIFNDTSTEWSVDNNAYPSAYQSSLDFVPNDHIQIPSTTNFAFGTSGFTISLWVNFDALTSGGYNILDFRTSGSGTTVGSLWINSTNGLRWYVGGGYLSASIPAASFSNNTWYNVIILNNGSTTSFYLNEASIDSASDTTSYTAAPLTIGDYSSGGYALNGKLSNLAIFNTALTTTNVTSLYNNGTPLADMSSFTSLVSWYKLNNTTTGIQDSKGSNNGTNSGATEYTGFVNTLVGESSGMDSSNLVASDLQQTSGYSPYALELDGLDDFLNSGSASYLNGLSEFSISCWFNITTAASSKVIVSDWNYNSGVLGHFALETRAASGGNYGLLLFIKATSDTGQNDVFTDSILRENTWNNAIFSFNSGTVTCYINGSSVSLTTFGTIPTTLTSQDGSLNIGKFGGALTRYWPGKLSNIALWNTELTQANATEIYNSGVPSNLNTFSGTKPIIWYQLGSNSSFNTNWTCLNEGSVTGSNAVSAGGMTNDNITNGPGYSANGLGSSTIDIVGDAPYSTANGLSENMDVLDRVSGTGNVPG